MKVHLHHSHITGKIIDYSHDFCNTALIEKTSPDIPVVAHNLFGTDLYYFIKGYIASAWCSKSLNIAGNNLTHINFSNIAGEIKFMGSLKFYLKKSFRISLNIVCRKKISRERDSDYFFKSTLSFFYCLALFEFSKKRKNSRNCV